MSEQNNSLSVLTQVTATAKINVALTAQTLSIQKLQNEADELEFTEDNIPGISSFLTKVKKALKVVDETHQIIKAPHWESCKVADGAKKSIIDSVEAISNPVSTKFKVLCAAVETRRLEQEREKALEQSIRSGIENNCIQFSNKIAECDTNEQLLSVERLINLEKSDSRKSKYMKFHDFAKNRYDEILLPILKSQKEKIKQKEDLEKQLKVAEDSNNASKVDELTQKKEGIDNEILQNKVDVQQNALNTGNNFPVTYAEEILPTVKSVNNILFEITDLVTVAKKRPELLEFKLKHRDTQKIAMEMKGNGVFDSKNEIIVDGIRFFTDTTFRP